MGGIWGLNTRARPQFCPWTNILTSSVLFHHCFIMLQNIYWNDKLLIQRRELCPTSICWNKKGVWHSSSWITYCNFLPNDEGCSHSDVHNKWLGSRIKWNAVNITLHLKVAYHTNLLFRSILQPLPRWASLKTVPSRASQHQKPWEKKLYIRPFQYFKMYVKCVNIC